MADLDQADQLQPNDLPTLQLHALVRLRLGDVSGGLDDLHGRADTVDLLMIRAYISSNIGDDEQALKDLVAADQIDADAADEVCDRIEDKLTASVAPQLRMAKVKELRHSVHTRIKVSFCRPQYIKIAFPCLCTMLLCNHRIRSLTCTLHLSQRISCSDYTVMTCLDVPLRRWHKEHQQLLITCSQTLQQVCWKGGTGQTLSMSLTVQQLMSALLMPASRSITAIKAS